MKKLIFVATILVTAICVNAMAVTPTVPGPPGTIYVVKDWETDPLGPGSGGMVGYGTGDHQGQFTIIADAAPFTGESQSLNFTKTGTTGYIGAYWQAGTAPSSIGYVIESVFRVNSDVTLAGAPNVLKAHLMSADFWVSPSTNTGKFLLQSWQSGIRTMELDLDVWHKVQGVRVNPSGSDEYMDYFVDGAYWRSSGEAITDGSYNNRIDIGYRHNADVGSLDFDHLMIYDPIPEPGTMLLLGASALLVMRKKK